MPQAELACRFGLSEGAVECVSIAASSPCGASCSRICTRKRPLTALRRRPRQRAKRRACGVPCVASTGCVALSIPGPGLLYCAVLVAVVVPRMPLSGRRRRPISLSGSRATESAYGRVLTRVSGYYQRSLSQNPVPCPICGHATWVQSGAPHGWHGVWYRCANCRSGSAAGFSAIILGLPEGRRFWRDHPRIRLLPERAVEVAGSVRR